MRSMRLILLFVVAPLWLQPVPVARAAWLPDGNPICRVPETLRGVVGVAHFRCNFGCEASLGLFWADGRSAVGTSIYAGGLSDLGSPPDGPGDVPATLIRDVPWGCTPLAAVSVPVLDHTTQFTPGATVLVWTESPPGSFGTLRARRLYEPADWGADGVLIASNVYQVSASAVPDDSGGVIIAWASSGPQGTRDYVQRIDANGSLRWGTGGILLGPDTTNHLRPHIAADGAGGLYVLRAARDSSIALPIQLYVNALYHFGRDGQPVAGWPAEGRRDIPMLAPHGINADLFGAELRADLSGCWVVGFGPSGRQVTRLLPGGGYAPGWTGAGAPVVTGQSGEIEFQDASIGASGDLLLLLLRTQVGIGGGLVAGSEDLLAQRIPKAGGISPGWGAAGVEVCTAPGRQAEGRALARGDGLFCAWSDQRSDAGDIYAVRLSADGTRPAEWPANGFLLCGATGAQSAPLLAGNFVGGGLVAWLDQRQFATYQTDLYGTSISGDAQIGLAVGDAAPREFALSSVRPNPARSAAHVNLELPIAAELRLEVFDVAGRLVHQQREHVAAGRPTIEWNLRDDAGTKVRPGLYLMQVSAGVFRGRARVLVAD
ncbi:MAG: hypothetical protein ABL977_05125 [Candidatus Eisenbacteria bacterium]